MRLILTMLIILLSTSMSDAQGDTTRTLPGHYYFEVLDANFEPILDAKIAINGRTARYLADEGKYYLNYTQAYTYDLRISHDKYVEVNAYHLMNLPSEFFLLTSDDKFVFSDGLKYPVTAESDELLMLAHDRIDKETKEFAQLLDFLREHKLRFNSDRDNMLDMYVKKGNRHLLYAQMIKKESGEPFFISEEDSSLLNSLREQTDMIRYVGQPYCFGSPCHHLSLDTGRFIVVLKEGFDEEKFKSFLHDLGVLEHQAIVSTGVSMYECKSSGLSIEESNRLLESIYNHTDVLTVSITDFAKIGTTN
jgi:hypothetical protein